MNYWGCKDHERNQDQRVISCWISLHLAVTLEEVNKYCRRGLEWG
jgi:hypothetical protein